MEIGIRIFEGLFQVGRWKLLAKGPTSTSTCTRWLRWHESGTCITCINHFWSNWLIICPSENRTGNIGSEELNWEKQEQFNRTIYVFCNIVDAIEIRAQIGKLRWTQSGRFYVRSGFVPLLGTIIPFCEPLVASFYFMLFYFMSLYSHLHSQSSKNAPISKRKLPIISPTPSKHVPLLKTRPCSPADKPPASLLFLCSFCRATTPHSPIVNNKVCWE